MKPSVKGAIIWFGLLLILPHSAWAKRKEKSIYNIINNVYQDYKSDVYKDYKNFYSCRNLEKLTIGLGISGISANTSVDRKIKNRYQDSVRSKGTDHFSDVAKQFGNGVVTIPIYLGVTIFGKLANNMKLTSTIGKWGSKSLRTILVGAPLMLFLQPALGSSRPEEDNSYWHPFKDNNGVSGHSFMGAVPFITAAEMTDNLYLKSLLYFGSTLCGLSRINDNAHYFSQSVLGWWLAYLASTSVKETNHNTQRVDIFPAFIPDGAGIMVIIHF